MATHSPQAITQTAKRPSGGSITCLFFFFSRSQVTKRSHLTASTRSSSFWAKLDCQLCSNNGFHEKMCVVGEQDALIIDVFTC